MYLNGTQVCYVGICARSVSDTSRGILSELYESIRRLEAPAQMKAIDSFFELEHGAELANTAIGRVRHRNKLAGKKRVGRQYIRAVDREVHRELTKPANDRRELIPE